MPALAGEAESADAAAELLTGRGRGVGLPNGDLHPGKALSK